LPSQEQGKLENVYTSGDNQGGLAEAKRRRARFMFTDVGKRLPRLGRSGVDRRPGRIHLFGFTHTLPSLITVQPTLRSSSMTRVVSIDIGAEAGSIRCWVVQRVLSDPRLGGS